MQSQQQSGNSDNSLDFLWLIVLIVGAIALAWYFGKNYIAAGIYQIKFYEIYVVQHLVEGYNKLVSSVSLPSLNLKTLTDWYTQIEDKSAPVSIKGISEVSNLVGTYIRFLSVPILIVLGIVLYFKNIGTQFCQTFDMQRLKNMSKLNWPQITPVSKIDLIEQDLDEGPWAMSLTPMQFCERYELLLPKPKRDPELTAKLNRSKAFQVFTTQLGPLWVNPLALPIHTQTLFAIFAATINHDRKSADKLLLQIANSSATTGKLDFHGVQPLLHKYANTKPILRLLGRNAYVLTVMASMLELARTNGVFACADFLWLKPVDRRLWYMLNTVGRQTAIVEVGGPFAHWLAEKRLSRALTIPMIDEAVNGLEKALKEIIYEPDVD